MNSAIPLEKMMNNKRPKQEIRKSMKHDVCLHDGSI